MNCPPKANPPRAENFINNNTKTSPVINSTKGYIYDIRVSQLLHLPFRAKKLNRGTRSYQRNFLSQDIQALLPPRDLAVLSRQITTFKKLPMIRPRTKKITAR